MIDLEPPIPTAEELEAYAKAATRKLTCGELVDYLSEITGKACKNPRTHASLIYGGWAGPNG
jgi:hypothetical protein